MQVKIPHFCEKCGAGLTIGNDVCLKLARTHRSNKKSLAPKPAER